jgi:hypothetical protein
MNLHKIIIINGLSYYDIHPEYIRKMSGRVVLSSEKNTQGIKKTNNLKELFARKSFENFNDDYIMFVSSKTKNW